MAKSQSEAAMEELVPEEATPVAKEPKGMYPRSPSESQDMIEQRRAAIAAAQKRAAEDAAEINRLTNEISVLNSLRQANGQAPV